MLHHPAYGVPVTVYVAVGKRRRNAANIGISCTSSADSPIRHQPVLPVSKTARPKRVKPSNPSTNCSSTVRSVFAIGAVIMGGVALPHRAHTICLRSIRRLPRHGAGFCDADQCSGRQHRRAVVHQEAWACHVGCAHGWRCRWNGHRIRIPTWEEAKTAEPGGAQGAKTQTLMRRQALASVRYWSIAAPLMLAIMVQVGFVVHQVSFLFPVLGREGAGLAVSLTAMMAATSRVVVGFFHRSSRPAECRGAAACGASQCALCDVKFASPH